MSLEMRLSALIAAIGADIKALFSASNTGGSAVPIGYIEQKLIASKASIASMAAGLRCSLWRATGWPAQANIPAASAVVCNSDTLGAHALINATGVNYIADVTLRDTNSGQMITLYDRLANMGGLNGTLTTAQTVGISPSALGLPAERIGAANYKELHWFLEWYTATGATAVTATVAVTYSDDSTGNLSAIALAATRRPSNLILLNEFIPTANANLGIKSVNTVTLSATTGTAGNFGVTVAREVMTVGALLANYPVQVTYAASAMPDVPNDACLWWTLLTSTTSTGTFAAHMRLVRAP